MNSLNEIQAENLKVNVTAIRLLVAKMECGGKMEKLRIHQTSQRNFARLYSSVCPRLYNRKKLLSTDFFFILFNDFGTCLLWSYPAGNTSQPINCFLAVRKRRGAPPFRYSFFLNEDVALPFDRKKKMVVLVGQQMVQQSFRFPFHWIFL